MKLLNSSAFLFLLPLLKGHAARIEPLVKNYKDQAEKLYEQNPYGVPISTGG